MGVGGGTSGYLVPKALREYERSEYSQIIVFTDMQMYNGSFNDYWKQYKQEVAPETSLYLVDLQNYGTLQTPEGAPDVYQLSGWSENVVDFIDKMENVDGMIREIESTEPDN
jgi:60 kDa SS-A/Ro ribonucleoprotein